MSVPTWKRSKSKVEFLNLLMELNINIGKITANKPKKYKANYGDHLIKEGLRGLKLELNPKHTNITRFDRGSFSYLKKRFCITETGKILVRLSRKNITRNRRKLKRMAQKGVDEPSASRTYQSWRGYAKQCSAYNSARNMEQLFYSLWR